jgi:thymidylate kinase
VSAERIKARGGPPEHYERDEVLGKLRSNYHEVWGWGRQHQGEKRWQVVNGVGTREEVLGRVLDIVNRPIAL